MTVTTAPIHALLNWSICLLSLAYALFQVYLLRFAVRLPRTRRSSVLPHQEVSVIIPCKNEEKRLPALFSSLQRLNYTADLEILFIDDGSTDRTRQLLEQFADDSAGPVRILTHRFDPQVSLTSKQQALELGITASSHELIALTDADMELHPDWLSSLCSEMNSSTALVFGHTVIAPTNTLFSLLQALQLEFLFSIAALFHYAGITGSCMGNNLLIRKSIYRECGGQNAIGYSIAEDRALLRLFHCCRRSTAIAVPFAPTATTPPHQTLGGFLQQISRWTLGGFSGGKNLFLFSVLFTIHIIVSLTACFGIFSLWCSLTVLGSFFISWLVVTVSFLRNRSTVSPLLYPILFPMILLEAVVVMGTIISGKKLQWKERSI